MKEIEVNPNLTSEDTYEAALAELLKLEFFGMKLGLQNITALMQLLDHPERTYKTIHIAGTNGKGSVAAMLAAVFQAAGHRVGLYTSPHLVNFRERIKVNGEMVPENFIRKFLGGIWDEITEMRATFFEVTTAMAFEYFKEARVDIAIIETGLGGRLDATNILETPIATVVTSIGWDHTKQLGNTLELIAGEKAGIFKHGVPAIVHVPRTLREVFTTRAREVGCAVYFVEDEKTSIGTIAAPLDGKHQHENLQTVLSVLSHIKDAPGAETKAQGISHLRELTGFRARLERYENAESRKRGFEILLDVGHNLDALRAVKQEMLRRDIRPIVVAGLMKDKDIELILREFAEVSEVFIAVNAGTERALESTVLADIAKGVGMITMDGGTVKFGVEKAFKMAQKGSTILICGSHYVVGEFLENEKAWPLVGIHAA